MRPPSGTHHQRKAAFTAERCAGCEPRKRCTKARGDHIVTIRPTTS
ncbi:transposase [Streptomyces laurentii]